MPILQINKLRLREKPGRGLSIRDGACESQTSQAVLSQRPTFSSMLTPSEEHCELVNSISPDPDWNRQEARGN